MGLELNLKPDTRPRKAKLTIEQFYLIGTSGAFDDYAKTELIDGEIHVVNSQFLPHMRVKLAILGAFQWSVREAALAFEVGCEGAVELGLHDVPEPDLFIFDAADAERGAPGSSVRLVVEVADTSERRDLGRKKRLYAQHGIPEYWVAVLRTRRIHRFADPADGDYRRHDDFAFADRIESITLPGVAIPAGALPG